MKDSINLVIRDIDNVSLLFSNIDKGRDLSSKKHEKLHMREKV